MPAAPLRIIAACLVLVAVALLAWLLSRGQREIVITAESKGATAPVASATRAEASTAAVAVPAPSASAAGPIRQHPLMPMHAGALSTLAPPIPFDAAAYARDPQAYVRQIDHSRVYQVAAPGPGVTRIQRESDSTQTVTALGSVELAVRIQPGAPATFVSYDRGAFANGFTAMTVMADGAGIARARFIATEGTIEDCNIKVGSPMHAGNVDFVVTVTPSNEPRQENPL